MWHAPAPFFEAKLVDVPGGMSGAFDTVAKMRALVRAAKTDPEMLNQAVRCIFMQTEHDQRAECEAIFNYVRSHIRYVRDVAGIETLAHPRMTILRGVGDCDDQSTLLATLFEAAGYLTRFVMAGYSSMDYEHVYCEVFCNGQWFACDPTVREFFGWAPPNAQIMWIEKV